MAEINFGLLDTQLPGRIATIPLQAQEAGQANALRAMQMMQGMQQNEASQMQLQKLRREQNTLSQIQAAIVGSGGPPDLKAAADAMMRSGDIEHVKLAQSIYTGLRNQTDAAAYRTRYMGPDVAPAPGVQPTAPSGNALPGAAQPTQRNALPGMAQGVAPGAASGVADPSAALNAKIKALERQYLSIGNNPELQSDKPLLLEQIKDVQRQLRDASALSPDVKLMQSLGYPPTQAGYIAFRDAQRQDRLLTPIEEEQRIRIALASRPPVQPVAPTITTVEDPTKPGKLLQVDARVYKGGGAGSPGVIGGAKPSATTEKLAAQRTQMGKDLGFAITQLADITRDGGLIDQSTGSGAGRLTDIGAGFFGKAMPGAIAIGKIAPIADLALKMVPRFEGPQSNADTKSYKEAAGQLADSSLPTEIRKEAGKVVLRIMQTRKNQFVTDSMAAEGATAEGAGAGNTGTGATGKWGTAVAE